MTAEPSVAVVPEKRKPAGIIGRVPVDKSTLSPTSLPANEPDLAKTAEPSVAIVHEKHKSAGIIGPDPFEKSSQSPTSFFANQWSLATTAEPYMAVIYENNKPAILTGLNTSQKNGLPPSSLPAKESKSIETSGYPVAIVEVNNKMAGLNESSPLGEPKIQRQVKPSSSGLPSDMSHLIDVELLQRDRIACLEDPGSMGDGLLIYMMVMEDARQWNEVNRVISIGKQHIDCPTETYQYLVGDSSRHSTTAPTERWGRCNYWTLSDAHTGQR